MGEQNGRAECARAGPQNDVDAEIGHVAITAARNKPMVEQNRPAQGPKRMPTLKSGTLRSLKSGMARH